KLERHDAVFDSIIEEKGFQIEQLEQVSNLISTYHCYYHVHNHHHRISSSTLFLLRSMVTATTSVAATSTGGGAFTTIAERVSLERDIKKSKFIAIAGHIPDERSAQSFLSEVQDARATHNCWAYKVGNQYRSNDDGEPSGTAGKPIYSAIENSGLDRVMVVVIRHFGGIKLGTGGLVRAYGGVAVECLKNAPTRLVKSQVPMGVEDYDTGKDGITMVTFKISFDEAEALEEALKTNCSRNLVQDARATHNCWAYKVGNQYRSKDDGEPSGTAGKPIYSAIENSGLDRVMVVVIRHFGGIKLGTGGLVRADGGVAVECLKNAPTRLVKSQVIISFQPTFPEIVLIL
ncbi:Impact family, partial [Cynara cardunculus var. scolymus]